MADKFKGLLWIIIDNGEFETLMKKIILIVLYILLAEVSFAQVSPKSEKELTTQQISALTLLGELWGFLKYYHLNVAKVKCDWDSVLIQKVPMYIDAKNKTEINKLTEDWLQQLGTVNKCNTCNNNISDSLKYNLDLSWIGNSNLSEKTKNKLRFIQYNRNQSSNHYVGYEPSFAVKITNEKAYNQSRFLYPDANYRLLLLFRYWNILNYFSPYKYLSGKDWKEILREKIPVFYTAKDTLIYHLECMKLINCLNDGHSTISLTEALMNFFGKFYWVPFECKYINKKFVVSKIYNDSVATVIKIKTGDVITEVNGEKVEGKLKRFMAYIGGSNDFHKQLVFAGKFLFTGKNNVFTIKKIRSDKFITDTFILSDGYIPNRKKESIIPWKIIDGNIGYVDMGMLQKEQVDKMMDELLHTKTIIYDIRNYPNDTWSVIAKYLCKEPFIMSRISFSYLNYPGVFRYKKSLFYGKANSNPYKGKVILLVDESSASHAEYAAMGLQAATQTITMGNTTAGQDGDIINFFRLPGGFVTRFSGLGIYYPDGTVAQRKGVKIDIWVRPTIKALQEQRDEVIEAAVNYIRHTK